MATSPLTITVDRQSRRIVQQFGGVASLPYFFQGDGSDLSIFVTDPPASSLTGAYSKATMTGFGMRVSVGATPTGSSGGPTPVALAVLTYDAASKAFLGQLALNTSGVDALIGAAASANAYFEIKLTNSGVYSTILQEQILIKAVVDEVLSTQPTPTDSYLTKKDTEATFQRREGLPGQTLVFRSPDGTKYREIGVDDNGDPIDNFF